MKCKSCGKELRKLDGTLVSGNTVYEQHKCPSCNRVEMVAKGVR